MDNCQRVSVLYRCIAVFTVVLIVTACQTIEVPETLTGTGVVEKVIAHDHRVIIAHDDIPGFMRAMTMSFEVKDPALLTRLTPGQRVRFTLEKKKETLYLVTVEEAASSFLSPILPVPDSLLLSG